MEGRECVHHTSKHRQECLCHKILLRSRGRLRSTIFINRLRLMLAEEVRRSSAASLRRGSFLDRENRCNRCDQWRGLGRVAKNTRSLQPTRALMRTRARLTAVGMTNWECGARAEAHFDQRALRGPEGPLFHQKHKRPHSFLNGAF